MLQLAMRPLGVAVLRPVARRSEMVKAAHEIASHVEYVLQGAGGGNVLAPLEMPLRLPDGSANASFRRWPVLHGGQV